MQIPLTLPELTTPLPARRDIQALSPVSPVPGVESIAETLDPRLALQWTQPVLADQSADPTRTALEGMTTSRSDASTATGLPTANAASMQTVTWSTLAQVLAPLLLRMSAASPNASVAWPEDLSLSPSSPLAPDGNAQALLGAMDNLHNRLIQSDLFAPQHLLRHWFTGSGPKVFSPSPHISPDQDTLSRWVSSLSPESTTAEQITRMLLNGKMHWQGELLPGIAIQLDREDAWREDPARPEQMQKGAALHAKIDLPRSGRLTVTGYQWDSHIELRVQISGTSGSPLHKAWPGLERQLALLNLTDLRLELVTTP